MNLRNKAGVIGPFEIVSRETAALLMFKLASGAYTKAASIIRLRTSALNCAHRQAKSVPRELESDEPVAKQCHEVQRLLHKKYLRAAITLPNQMSFETVARIYI